MNHVLPSICCLLFLTHDAGAQFVLEHTYPNGATGVSPNNELYMVELETIDPLYVLLDRSTLQVSLMDLGHTIVALYDLTSAPAPPNTLGYDVLYVTQHLFDSDPGIEMMVVVSSQVTTHTSILDDDGTVMHTFYDEYARVNPNVPQDQRPIYNTPNGARLILSSAVGSHANVYALAGTLTTGMAPSPVGDATGATMRIFPNPTTDVLHVQCNSPSFGRAEMIIVDATGSMVLRKAIVLSTQTLDVAHLTAGEYTYSIMHGGQRLASGRFLKQ